MNTPAPTFHLKTLYSDTEVEAHLALYGGKTDDGRLIPALQLTDTFTGEEAATVTVNLAGYGIYPAPGCILVKDYSENEGMATALANAAVAKSVGRTHVINPFGSRVVEMQLLGALAAQWIEFEADNS